MLVTVNTNITNVIVYNVPPKICPPRCFALVYNVPPRTIYIRANCPPPGKMSPFIRFYFIYDKARKPLVRTFGEQNEGIFKYRIAQRQYTRVH